MLKFHETVVFIGTFVLSITFIMSLIAKFKYKLPHPLKNFFIVPLLGVLITINTIFSNVVGLYKSGLGGIIERSIMLLEFVFWVYFFYSIGLRLPKSMGAKFVLILVFLGFAGLVGYNFSSNHFHHFTNSIFLMIQLSLSLIFIIKLFNHPPKQLLISNPIFLIVTGLLIKCAVALPTHLALDTMYIGKQSTVYRFIFPVANIAVIVTYAYFIYAFICIKKEYNNVIDFNPKNQQ